MIIGLIGAHRTGKTTLAKRVKELTGVKLIEVNLSQAQRILGFDSAKQDYTFKERRVIQDGLLDYMTQLLHASANGDVIYDRTPLDLIGYSISLANSNVLDEDDEVWLEKFIFNCHRLNQYYMDKVFLVQPGIPLVNDNSTSAACQQAYINHLNYIYRGVLLDINYNTQYFMIPTDITDLDQRVNFILHN